MGKGGLACAAPFPKSCAQIRAQDNGRLIYNRPNQQNFKITKFIVDYCSVARTAGLKYGSPSAHTRQAPICRVGSLLAEHQEYTFSPHAKLYSSLISSLAMGASCLRVRAKEAITANPAGYTHTSQAHAPYFCGQLHRHHDQHEQHKTKDGERIQELRRATLQPINHGCTSSPSAAGGASCKPCGGRASRSSAFSTAESCAAVNTRSAGAFCRPGTKLEGSS